MIYQDYEKVKERWLEFWNKENHDRPIMSIVAPKSKIKQMEYSIPQKLIDRWLDMDYIIAKSRSYFENTYFAGEAFPTIFPNLGPDLTGAVCGCDIEFGEDTSWAIHNVNNWNELPKIVFDENNKWWKQIVKMTKELINDAKGDYLIGVSDLHPGTDCLVSLRGPQELCMDVFDNHEIINPRVDEIFEVHKQMLSQLNSMISKVQEGSTNWTGIWHPQKNWYVTSCDFSCLISAEDFEGYVIPGLQKELDLIPASMYHLDGPGALRHLDRLLELPNLNCVQWVPGSGAAPAREWIDVYKKIQKAGKNVQAYCEPLDIKPLCENLEPEGLNLVCYAKNEEEANDIVNMATKIYNNKIKS